MANTYSFMVLPSGKLPDGIKAALALVIPTYAGKKLRFTVEEAKEKRALDQNSYYWAAIVPHVRKYRAEMGDPVSIDQTHEDLLEQFAPRVAATRLDRTPYTRAMRSKEMSVQQMAEYITVITATMAQFGNPVLTLDYTGEYA